MGLDSRGQRISPRDLDSLDVMILSLLEPDEEQFRLQRCGSDTWRVPQDSMEAGPYLILGRQGDWHRVQPMLWYVPQQGHPGDADASAASTVARAYAKVSLGECRSSEEPFRPVVTQLAADPGHPDWPLVFGYLRRTSLPVATFPLLRALVRNPVACVTAAAHASAEDFELLWERMEQLPFAWWQIPLCSWQDAFVAYGQHWEGVLDRVEDTDLAWQLLEDETDRCIDRVKGRLGGLLAAFRFLSDRVAGRPISDKGSKIVTPEKLNWLQQEYDQHRNSCPALSITPYAIPELQGLLSQVKRVAADHPWCRSLFVKRTGVFEEPRCADVADAPALAAAMVVADIEASDELAHGIRGVRANHRSWFDEALRLAQFIAFGRREAAKIQRQIRLLQRQQRGEG